MLSASDTCLSTHRSEDCQQTGQNPRTIKEDGYLEIQIFMRAFREKESVVGQYNRDLAECEYQVNRKPATTTEEQRKKTYTEKYFG